MKKLRIIGAGGHGKVVADIAKRCGYSDIIFLDDDPAVLKCGSYPVDGTRYDALHDPDAVFFVAVGNPSARAQLMEWLSEQGLCIISLVHPGAIVAEDVIIGEGSVIMAGAVINPGTVLEKGVIVNTCASVDHDCRIGKYVHISVGARIAGTVTIGEHTWVSVGAVVSNNITVGSHCIIGAGAVVINDITESGTYLGVPARKK